MKSILQDEKVCWMCKRLYNLRTVLGLEEHHVFQGRHRQLSEQYGLKVWLCARHHRDLRDGVHFNMRYAAALKNKAKRVFCDKYGEDAFFQVFGKTYEGSEEEC